ncbi:hypothetical protein RSOL_135670, partial [Rhizoctonia solani AG-3 Rhs1AP]
MGHDSTNILAKLKSKFKEFLENILFKCIARSLGRVLDILHMIVDVGAVLTHLVGMQGLVRKFSETLRGYGEGRLKLNDAKKQALALAGECDDVASEIGVAIEANK